MIGRSLLSWLVFALLVGSPAPAGAVNLDINSKDSIKNVAKELAANLWHYYNGDQPGGSPGNLPAPYYWWQTGAMFGSFVYYYAYTGDSTYNKPVSEGILSQASSTDDFMPTNQSIVEGNDDQGFWAMTAMAAAERSFPNPPKSKPQWLELAQGVFDSQAARWDTSSCNGGLRWQIDPFETSGYHYKNSISNGLFFNLAARLYHYTGNATFKDWATKTWDWVEGVGLVQSDGTVIDGASDSKNCTGLSKGQYSYNYGVFVYGTAIMYNKTEDNAWKTRTENIVNKTKNFFKNGIMYEEGCEPSKSCSLDQQSFKAYLARWLGDTMQVAPYTVSTIEPLLRKTAQAVGKACSGYNNNTCGLYWTDSNFQKPTGLGEQMSGLEVVLSLLAPDQSSISTAPAGSSSDNGNSSSGASDSDKKRPSAHAKNTSAGNRVGTSMLSIFVLAWCVFGAGLAALF